MVSPNGSEWHEVWNDRSIDSEWLLRMKDRNEFFLELKKLNGFDITTEVDMNSFLGQLYEINKEINFTLKDDKNIESIYEVGCGSGANLYIFESLGYRTGGIDYSESLIDTAKKVLKSDDILCDEAINIEASIKYDTVISNSVFSYFPDYDYTAAVLDKMMEKTNRTIAIIDIHDLRLKKEFIEYRKRICEDYEERYRNLPKLFYPKTFFLEFAEKNNLDVKFSISDVKGYWNNPFVFSCYYYKR